MLLLSVSMNPPLMVTITLSAVTFPTKCNALQLNTWSFSSDISLIHVPPLLVATISPSSNNWKLSTGGLASDALQVKFTHRKSEQLVFSVVLGTKLTVSGLSVKKQNS